MSKKNANVFVHLSSVSEVLLPGHRKETVQSENDSIKSTHMATFWFVQLQTITDRGRLLIHSTDYIQWLRSLQV